MDPILERHPLTSLVAAASAVIALSACGRAAPDAGPAGTTSAEPADTAIQAPADSDSPDHEYLRDEAERLLAFLRGEGPLPGGLLADSVTLYIAPEGGGRRRRAASHELDDRASWRVGERMLLPPPGATELTLHPGRHWNCRAVPLTALFPSLASSPHIAASLTGPGVASCLQTWNLTFIFSADRATPLLTGVVYDQWEW